MTGSNVRKPLKNFFVKKTLQLSMVAKYLFIVALSTVFTTVILAFIYHTKSRGGSFYYMSDNIMEDLELQSILGLILPALIAAQVVSMILVFAISLLSSRKIAVPLYKIEKWARQVNTGKLTTSLAFRETEEMRDITQQCNGITERFKRTLADIEEATEAITKAPADNQLVSQQAARIKSALNTYEF
jgi:methyl-accepting chemotaxis protein